jgi:hypothetical protein
MSFRSRYFGFLAVLMLSAFLTSQCGDDKSSNSSPRKLVTDDTTVVLIADHTYADDFDHLAGSVFAQVRASYNFFYGHTSHGSQIITGLGMLEGEDTLYAPPIFYEYGDDLGTAGDTTWVPPTRTYLDTHTECNVVMWSWCGGCTGNDEAGIAAYLQAMSDLEEDYPDVTFIYMTGHLDGSGPSGSLYRSNNQIREYCNANGKVLFDFADIESYDPEGTYYPDETDACAWCSSWCSSHTCVSCGGCAHSHCFNCYRKGQAFWSLMAELYARDH